MIPGAIGPGGRAAGGQLVTVWTMSTAAPHLDRCDRCQKDLPFQHDIQLPGSIQYDNALVVRLDGGYGMFVDDPFRSEHLDQRGLHPIFDALLCHECAHDLAVFLGKDARTWHTHRPGSGMHPDHHDS